MLPILVDKFDIIKVCKARWRKMPRHRLEFKNFLGVSVNHLHTIEFGNRIESSPAGECFTVSQGNHISSSTILVSVGKKSHRIVMGSFNIPYYTEKVVMEALGYNGVSHSKTFTQTTQLDNNFSTDSRRDNFSYIIFSNCLG